MTKTDTTKRAPTHRVFAVRKSDGDKSFWTQIGVAWANQDGKGFNLRLSLIPLDGSDIVVRKAREGDAK